MIGSGAVESGCKQIIIQQLKRTGEQWNVEGVVLTVNARAVWLSGDWDHLCAQRKLLHLAS